jgi:hypothetical protein
MGDTFFVSLDMRSAMEAIENAVVRGSITGECIDQYGQGAPNGGGFVVMVYEKHYYRAGNRLTLTVTLDDFTGRTRVHCVGGGGGEGLFRFDWGASKSFAGVVQSALAPWRV